MPLHHNNQDGTFTEVTGKAGMCIVGTGMGVAVGDYDNDGWLDLYVTNTGRNFLWQNQKDGTFRNVEVAAGVADTTSLGWGTAFVDYDNDGWLDLYVVNGDVFANDTNRPNVGQVRVDRLYRNLENGTFAETARLEGVSGDNPKAALALVDFDKNGGMDIFVLASYLQGTENGTKHHLYRNVSVKGHWLQVQLRASKGSPLAIGARVTVRANGTTQMRDVSAGGSFVSEHELPLHFGLGSAKKADVQVMWPNGTWSEIKDVAADQLLTIKQP